MKSLILSLTFLVASVGCITTAEHRAFVKASEKFANDVGEDYLKRLEKPAPVSTLTLAIRRKVVDEYKKAVAAAKERSK